MKSKEDFDRLQQRIELARVVEKDRKAEKQQQNKSTATQAVAKQYEDRA